MRGYDSLRDMFTCYSWTYSRVKLSFVTKTLILKSRHRDMECRERENRRERERGRERGRERERERERESGMKRERERERESGRG